MLCQLGPNESTSTESSAHLYQSEPEGEYKGAYGEHSDAFGVVVTSLGSVYVCKYIDFQLEERLMK